MPRRKGREVDGLDREAGSLGRGHRVTEGAAPAIVEFGEFGGHRDDRDLGCRESGRSVEWSLTSCLCHHSGGKVRKVEVGGKDGRDVVVGTRGHDPTVESAPTVGFTPTIPCRPAGTPPYPAVSVPIAMSAKPSATATADPELDPPEIRSGRRESRTAP